MAKPPFEWKVRDELDAYMPEEIFLTEVRAKIGLEIYTKLVEQVRKEMLESAMVSIDISKSSTTKKPAVAAPIRRRNKDRGRRTPASPHTELRAG